MTLYNVLLTSGILTGAAFTTQAAPVSVADTLHEITVQTDLSRRPAAFRRDGTVIIGGKSAAEQPSFMGSGDAAGVLKTLPAVTTAAELQASLPVRGGSGGDNLFEADGVRIVNPMHMLGFYSAFNPAYYKNYSFRVGRLPACMANATGAVVTASSFGEPPSGLTGSLSAGLIESHGAVSVPAGRSSFSAGVRQSYLNLLFPDIIKMDETVIKYGFSEANANWDWRSDSVNTIRATFFFSRDRMNLDNDKGGRKDGEFGWRNIASGLSWQHRDLVTSLSVTNYHNDFDFSEGGRGVSLPSGMTQLTARAQMPAGDFDLEADISYRNCSGQHNELDNTAFDNPGRHAAEGSVAADWSRRFAGRWQIDAGLRLTCYHCNSYATVMPMPRLTLSWLFSSFSLYAAYSRTALFDQLIEETTASLPADFRLNCDGDIRPRDTHAVEAGIHGFISPVGIGYTAQVYWQRMFNVVEFDGSLIDLVNPGYNPAAHLTAGKGYAAGLTVALTRSYGRLRGRIGYNLGVARLKNKRYDDRYYAAPHDRLHDLKAVLSYDIFTNFTVSASFTHATGTHYTRAKYGYMIGENLICEYFPHNSSRLPSYNRLDLSANWIFLKKRRCRHTLNISVYNATAAHNVLFIYTSYSLDKGIHNRRSVMKSVIPSLSYAIEF